MSLLYMYYNEINMSILEICFTYYICHLTLYTNILFFCFLYMLHIPTHVSFGAIFGNERYLHKPYKINIIWPSIFQERRVPLSLPEY